MESESKLLIKNIYKIFGDRPEAALKLVTDGINKQTLLEQHNHVLALNNINLEVSTGKFQVVMGLSGSGKSTLIRHVNRLIEPTAGSIFFHDDDVTNLDEKQLRYFRRFRTSMVFQNFALLPHRTVLENISYGLEIQKQEEKVLMDRSLEWLNRVGLDGYNDYYPTQLSGGMQQRVGLARALATDAEILLMDEPFSALDPLIREEMQDVLINLQNELKKTIIFITHDLDEALRIGDKVAILKDGEIIQNGSPEEIILNPANEYVTDFTKNINRGRILTIGAIIEDAVLENAIKIDKKITLEAALRTINEEGSQFANVVDNSRVIGSVSQKTIINAITSGTEVN